ncbi:josephin-like protein [Vigna radiata var. radiata]|uniref:ubiquitinyl hydrolase 1 n=1 Tax=Vigna radiata var. radiata TaxID=3916 RepID=A0A3Q0F1F9_VIGRR|nr:josephin-like protein [Vigna radiata var. radiata]
MMATDNSEVYHERQRLQFCLVHSLNSLFQQKDAFTRAKLNEISERLAIQDSNTETWTPFSFIFKPHHNVFTGNYDVNVLIAALEEKGKSVEWHDRRKGASCIDLDAPVLMGIVINVSASRFAGIWRSRHWIALRKINGVWFNLDSDLDAPQPFLDTHEVRKFLDFTLAEGGEVLIVLNEKQSCLKLLLEDVLNRRLYLFCNTLVKLKFCFQSLPYNPSTLYNIIIALSPNAIIIQTGISNKMSHSGYINEKTGLSLRQNSSRKSTRNGQVKSCMFRIPWQSETSPVELVKDLAERVTNALRLMSSRRSLHRGSSSLTRSKSAGSSVDFHRTAAVEDCIEFIHSSFSRSNSSTTAPRQDSIQAP